MTSERVQRQIDRFLDEAEEAMSRSDWAAAKDRAENVLALDPENADAQRYLTAAERRLGTAEAASESARTKPSTVATTLGQTPPQPTSFASGRYEVKRFLGEGGKKKVYLAHDAQLDRDVALALIKTEGLDNAARVRITREAQAMGRLGSHPHIVTVYDIGEQDGQPYLVLPVLPGGDVEGVIEKAPDHKLSIEQAVKIATETCLGLEFSHAKGIIHRDLKPGNVWLAEDGRAMIGDFGLAVAVDRSRLTQAGMMVGTVNYMPPEQAMGGEVTPQSDLYSLGAMLYEMVCGRPPFVGDESVAIIGQHLNTPPVAPSWHRPDCPPGLEALILRLLEKDASKRPGSAAEVREALVSISAAPIVASVHQQVTSPHQHEPLYRRVFVGREQEVRQLQQAFDAAMSGQGGLIMVVGEPGIGKTSIVEQLETYVRLRGGMTLVGHSYEEGSLSLPYLPFIEAMRSYVLERDAEGLRSDLGSGASEVARIVSEVRDKVNVTPSAGGDPEEQRWRLMEAVKEFLRNASRVQPLLVELEDLHDSDRGTLDLLVHLARSLEGARLLIVGTYRDVEVDRAHPLSSALAELRRGRQFQRIPLRGLTVDEVHRLYTAIRGNEVPRAQAEAVHRQTEGNPLFIIEVLRYLVEEGLVVRQDGRYDPIDSQGPGDRIPEGLRDVIGKRLSLMSERTNQVLSVAAVIGRDFRFDVLQQVASLSEDEVIEALEEATGRAVIEQRGDASGPLGFRFTHAFFRQTLYEELFAARRIRMHRDVARALESTYGLRVEEHASELAEHYANSSDPGDLEKSVHYSEVAAQRALAVFAYGEAVGHLDQAIKAQEVLNPGDLEKRCDLLIELAKALIPAGGAERAFKSVAVEALQLAEEIGRADYICRAALAGLVAGPLFLEQNFLGSDLHREWTSLLAENAEPGTAYQGWAEHESARLLIQEGRVSEAWSKNKTAFTLAKQLGDNDLLAVAALWIALGAEAPVADLGARREAAATILEHGLTGSTGIFAFGYPPVIAAGTFLTWGERGQARHAVESLDVLAERTKHPSAILSMMASHALFATWEGALEEAVALSEEMHALTTYASGRAIARRVSRRPLFFLGRAQEALNTLPPPPLFWNAGGAFSAQRAIYLAHSGQTAEATELIDRFFSERDFADPEDGSAATLLRYLLEASVAAGHRKAAEVLESRLAPLADLLFTEPAEITNCMGRELGDAAVLLGEPEKARTYYQRGIAVCEKGGHRPELALTRAHLAELLLDHYPDEHATAIEHLDFAIAEFREMKMQPALERALGRRGLLKA